MTSNTGKSHTGRLGVKSIIDLSGKHRLCDHALPVSEQTVAVVAGIDRILDIARTALNVAGDCACTVLIAKSEGQMDMDVYATPHVLEVPDMHDA